MSRSLTKLLTCERKFGYNEGQKVNVTNPTNDAPASRLQRMTGAEQTHTGGANVF